ncbi:hypothetical protein Taro_015052 [Colocasia esculenta]|uniref:Uncharacterized protein n=1 Tax=Colocasia esculenta TaxID=4460 RepID=A0A843UGC9_COLES|nr:hypothetical protein [Colocasia esculenta]
MGSCGGALGGWGAMDRPQEGHPFPLFVCFSLFKPSSWSRPKLTILPRRTRRRSLAADSGSAAWPMDAKLITGVQGPCRRTRSVQKHRPEL